MRIRYVSVICASTIWMLLTLIESHVARLIDPGMYGGDLSFLVFMVLVAGLVGASVGPKLVYSSSMKVLLFWAGVALMLELLLPLVFLAGTLLFHREGEQFLAKMFVGAAIYAFYWGLWHLVKVMLLCAVSCLILTFRRRMSSHVRCGETTRENAGFMSPLPPPTPKSRGNGEE